ncbi:myb-related protein MYBAS1-like [Phragmites australis]|uniref:myb-related protein MYBAS1-like n=1 Tax=Phragmites australis TaxID=29695 RepID=UPI002D79CD66|nr:myb-related protein MYBAS1-like [Phragmites australis]
MSMCSKNDKKDGEQTGGSTMTVPAMRKGPWMEEEDAQLVWFVRLFGERRWDFLAKVSGLRRTGKSCRLRWVNYLHPGLRRGRITAEEERLILSLHEQWGSRWSRIARSLPGRTDNEIKNFWRTRTRKKALEERRQNSNNKTAGAAASPSSSLASDSPGSPNSGGTATSSSVPSESAPRESTGDEAELEEASTTAASQHQQQPHQEECCTMDQLWNEIAAADAAESYVVDSWGACHGAAAEAEPSSPVWEFCSDYSLWGIDDEEYYKKMLDAS